MPKDWPRSDLKTARLGKADANAVWPRLIPSMGVCLPCLESWAGSLCDCCERWLGHVTADLSYKIAYRHVLGCAKIGVPPWPWKALLLLQAGSDLFGRGTLLLNEGTCRFSRGGRRPQAPLLLLVARNNARDSAMGADPASC